jgi:hypothetical protein
VSTFRRDVVITLEGEPYKCQTRAVDHTAAEVLTVAKGEAPDRNQISHGFRVAFQTFRRTHPDHELAGSYGRFLDALDEVEGLAELEPGAGELEPDPLDPTRPAVSDG